MARLDLLVSWRQRLATGSPLTERPMLPAGTRQDKGIKEPR